MRYAGRQMQYLGAPVEEGGNLSPETRQTIDQEIQRVVTEQYTRAQKMLREHHGALHALATQLLEHETVDGAAVRSALEKEKAEQLV